MGSPGGDGVVTAAVLIIGDEILSGRTQDTNLRDIARYLGVHGVDLCEARTVPDVLDEIVDALNALRARYDYVITTGGIGPTHDDITADAVAAAFGVELEEHPDILAMMQSRWGDQMNAARRRMARVPVGGSLVNNPVQGPPGFTIGNVFVLAGVPQIMRGMLEDVGPRLRSGWCRRQSGRADQPLRPSPVCLGLLVAGHNPRHRQGLRAHCQAACGLNIPEITTPPIAPETDRGIVDMKSYSAAAITRALDKLAQAQLAGETIPAAAFTRLEDTLKLLDDQGWRSLHADQVSSSTRLVLEEYVEPVP